MSCDVQREIKGIGEAPSWYRPNLEHHIPHTPLREEENNVRMVVDSCGANWPTSMASSWMENPTAQTSTVCHFNARQVEHFHQFIEVARRSSWAAELLALCLHNPSAGKGAPICVWLFVYFCTVTSVNPSNTRVHYVGLAGPWWHNWKWRVKTPARSQPRFIVW